MEEINKKIKDLAGENLQRMGQWEITQVPEPVFKLQTKNGSNPMLNLVVHRESYFIFNTYIASPEEINSAAKALIEAIEKHKIIPETLLVREKTILKELEPIAYAFKFEIVYPSRFKAVPNVLREMRNFFRNPK
jgi:hypothetical protein